MTGYLSLKEDLINTVLVMLVSFEPFLPESLIADKC